MKLKLEYILSKKDFKQINYKTNNFFVEYSDFHLYGVSIL